MHIDLYERRFPIAVVKECCKSFYNRPLTDRTWKIWKEFCNIESNRRIITSTEFLFLFALTYYCKQYPSKPLNEKKILDLCGDIYLNNVWSSAIDFLDRCCFYKGYDLPKILKLKLDLDFSIKDLKDKIESFSINKEYKLEDILEKLK